jgi:hypothetical protein
MTGGRFDCILTAGTAQLWLQGTEHEYCFLAWRQEMVSYISDWSSGLILKVY